MDGAALFTPPEVEPGTVWLVGAGPGDPGLVSWLGLSGLRSADAVIHDAAVPAAIVALIPAGRLAQPAGDDAVDAVARCVALAREGWRVVRLFEGDPLATDAGTATAAALRSEEIPLRIVPGIRAASLDPEAVPAGVPSAHAIAHATDFSMVGIAG